MTEDSDQIEFGQIMKKRIKETDCDFAEAFEFASEEIERRQKKVSETIKTWYNITK